MEEPGERILSLIDELKRSGVEFKHGQKGNQYIYTGSGGKYSLRLEVEPKKWLGLTFIARLPDHKKEVQYSINTDLYDISDANYREFTREVESEITDFLHNLVSHHILISGQKNKLTLLIPQPKGFLCVSRGHFLTTTKRCNEVDMREFEEIT